ncbi:MAG: hypothetical protein LBC80_05630 [Treponema sp.]|jgi:hypothetical protein|nr:hypothetical protein [Treponema sp.]
MKTTYPKVVLILAVLCLFPFWGYAQQSPARSPINVNLIIDSSSLFADVKTEIINWVNARLDQVLAQGDRVTVWSAGPSARVIYSGTINSQSDRDAVKSSYRELSGTGSSADFSGALREAAELQTSTFSYTLLVSASPQSLSSVLSGPQANLLRFSRVEEFPGWRVIVVGLNIDTKVRRAAAAFFN